ncbi:MAG TPA: pitrilysin family protein [Malonomonas sp.]
MIRTALWMIVFSLLAGCTLTGVTPQPVRPDQLEFAPLSFHFPQLEQQRLNNGLKFYLQEDHELPLVELTLMIGGGSIQDPPEKTGLSHVFAAALETGGAGDASAAELEAELEAMAAELSVTSSSYAYQLDLSLHRRDLQRGIEILADLLRRPGFAADRFELARSQMLETIRRKNDDPDSIARRLLSEAVFPGHPFGSSPQRAAVESFSRDDLIQLHQAYFRPDNVWLAASGDLARAELLVLLQENFGDWTAPAVSGLSLPELPQPPQGRVLIADKNIPQTSIMLGHIGINKDNPDYFPLRVANYILGGGGFNSRMMREVRSNRGLAYSVYSSFEQGRRLPELFYVSSETKTASTVEVVTLLRQLMQQMIDEPVAEKELQLAKQSLINSFVFAFTDSHSVVSRKVRLDFYAYPTNYLESYQEKIAAVTIADVQRVAAAYLKPDLLQIVLVGDSSEFAPQAQSFGLPVESVELEVEL